MVDVKPDHLVVPGRLEFSRNAKTTLVVLVSPSRAAKMIVSGVETTHPAFVARLIPAAVTSKDHRLEVTYDPSVPLPQIVNTPQRLLIITDSVNEPTHQLELSIAAQ